MVMPVPSSETSAVMSFAVLLLTTAARLSLSPTTMKRGVTGRMSRSLVLLTSDLAFAHQPVFRDRNRRHAPRRQVVGQRERHRREAVRIGRDIGFPVSGIAEIAAHAEARPRFRAAAAALGFFGQLHVDAIDRVDQRHARANAQAALAVELIRDGQLQADRAARAPPDRPSPARFPPRTGLPA